MLVKKNDFVLSGIKCVINMVKVVLNCVFFCNVVVLLWIKWICVKLILLVFNNCCVFLIMVKDGLIVVKFYVGCCVNKYESL